MKKLFVKLDKLGYEFVRIDSDNLLSKDHIGNLHYIKDGVHDSVMINKGDKSDKILNRILKK
jgi:hypothetical protein